MSRGVKARALALIPVLGLTLLALNCAPVVNALSKLSQAESIPYLTGFKSDGKITDFPDENQIMVAEETDNLASGALQPAVSAQNEVKPDMNDDNKVLNSAEEMPHFPGGTNALLEFVGKNIKYPDSETDNPNTVRVIVKFVVDANGKVGRAEIFRGGPEAFNREALRVVKMLPDFTPGKINGKNVAVWYTLPVIFKAKKDPGVSTSATTPTQTASFHGTYEKKAIPDSDPSCVFRSVEKMPQFPGGERALLEFVTTNLKYPENEVNENKQGRIVVSFVVKADGKIGETKIIRSLGEDFDAEAIRVIKMLPDFTPGQMDGKNVAVWYNLPIIFKRSPDKSAEN